MNSISKHDHTHTKKLVIYWLRRDFRLRDNQALHDALKYTKKEDAEFLPLFILEDYMVEENAEYQFGYPSRFFLAQAVPLYIKQFKNFLITTGTTTQIFKKIQSDLGSDTEVEIFVNEDIHPDFYTQIRKIRDMGIVIHLKKDRLTVDRNTKTGTGNTYSVFTPFKHAVWTSFVQEKEVTAVSAHMLQDAQYSSCASKKSLSTRDFAHALVSATHESIKVGSMHIDIQKQELPHRKLDEWYFSEEEAMHRFKAYLKQHMSSYKEDRDSLALDTTSKMSIGLAWGLVSARTLLHLTQKHFTDTFESPYSNQSNQGAIHFISELIWREFYAYLFFHNPALLHEEFQQKFRGTIEWAPHAVAVKRFQAWIRGETGYAIVDAAMMQLAQTGWMHNRARMIVASVLTKNLGVDWRWGQEYFRAMLIDCDEASNVGGWQWGASVGADPKPIRIFNPYLQAKNYDSDGVYQKKWLRDGYKFDATPLVPHEDAREDALKRYGLKKSGGEAVRDF